MEATRGKQNQAPRLKETGSLLLPCNSNSLVPGHSIQGFPLDRSLSYPPAPQQADFPSNLPRASYRNITVTPLVVFEVTAGFKSRNHSWKFHVSPGWKTIAWGRFRKSTA
jgi:hypothetical protein